METTDWDRYGTGNYEKCADCMVHSGYEATAVLEISCFAIAFALLAPLLLTMRGGSGASEDSSAAKISHTANEERATIAK